MGGGILPVALYKKKIYFLFSREYIYSSDRDRGLWSDFGGSKEKNESQEDTAIREGWEESSGILGSKSKIKYLVKNKVLRKINVNGYCTYIVLIKYNENLPKKFRKHFLKVKKDKPHMICKNGLYEKDMLRWVEYNDIKTKKFYKFRRWYKSIVREITKAF